MIVPILLTRRLVKVLSVLALCLVNAMVMATEVTETFEAAGFSNHQDFSSVGKITVGSFEYKVQANGSLKTVIVPAAISIGFDRTKPVTRFTISHTSNEAFAFRGFTASNQFEMSGNATVSGYLGGSLVTAAISVTVPWPIGMLDFSAIPEFANVDEVRIENSDLYFIFEDLQYTVKEVQTITFADPADLPFISVGTFPAPATSTSSLTVIIDSLTPLVCDVTAQTVTMISVGFCELTASQPGDANYKPAANVTQTVELQKANQTINFLAPFYKSTIDDPFSINATATSSLAVVFASSTPAVCSLSGDTVSLIAAGVCTISANQSGDGSYNAAPEVLVSITVLDFGFEVIKVAEIAKPILQYMNNDINYAPEGATGVYSDVLIGSFNADWLEELAVGEIFEGCATNQLCPQMAVSKEQLAKILLKAKLGSGYSPPGALGLIFTDVLDTGFSADWIEDLSNKEITEGCATGLFCPKELVTVSVFIKLLNKAFPR